MVVLIFVVLSAVVAVVYLAIGVAVASVARLTGESNEDVLGVAIVAWPLMSFGLLLSLGRAVYKTLLRVTRAIANL